MGRPMWVEKFLNEQKTGAGQSGYSGNEVMNRNEQALFFFYNTAHLTAFLFWLHGFNYC